MVNTFSSGTPNTVVIAMAGVSVGTLLTRLDPFQMPFRHHPDTARKILLRQSPVGQQGPNLVRLHLARPCTTQFQHPSRHDPPAES